MKDSVFKNILVNTRAFFTKNLSKEINRTQGGLLDLESRIEEMEGTMKAYVRNLYSYRSVLQYFTQNKQEAFPYLKEIEFIRRLGHFCNFPYHTTLRMQQCESGFDAEAGMPYVVHDGKKLFFPAIYDVESALRQYNHLKYKELILKTEDDEPAPHCYQSERICLRSEDCLFDIGSAEGLFALHYIEKVGHVVLVECNPVWYESLQKTFAPYRDKVDIVKKQLGAEDKESMVSLPTLLTTYASSDAFVKMDIEGSEVPSIMASEQFLKSYQGNVKFAVAAYHRQDDADLLKKAFDQMKYYTEFSKGYMLFDDYDIPLPPFFRHGIVRASNMQ